MGGSLAAEWVTSHRVVNVTTMAVTKGQNEKGSILYFRGGGTERGSNPELDFLFSLIAVSPDRLQGFEGALCRNRLVNGGPFCGMQGGWGVVAMGYNQ